MNDLTIWQLIICTSPLVWLLCGIEMYFVFRFARKKAILGKIEKDNYLSVIPSFCERFSANLYGTPIEVAIKDDFIYFINNGRCFCINIDEFISIKEKKGKYIFRLAKTSIANTKVFAIKCNDSAFRAKLFSLLNNNAKENDEKSKEILLPKKTKLWNNPKALYLISAILFGCSLVLSMATSFSFIVVELITVVFVIIGAIWLNSWKFPSMEDFSKVLLVAMIVGVIIMIIALIVEGPNVTIGWQEEWHKCYKCNGTGKVRNDLGYYVNCPRCDGVGGLDY